jgi:hypothetical protein
MPWRGPAGRIGMARSGLHTHRMSARTTRQPPPERAPAEYAYGSYADGDRWADNAGRGAGASVYWRRRFIALVVGLAVLAVVAWALNGAINGRAPANSSGTNSANTTNTGITNPLSATNAPNSAASHGSTTGSGKKGGAGAVHHSPSPGPSASHHPAAGQRGLKTCARSDVVLSVFSAQANYSARQTPEFTIDVVSTAPKTCTFNIGASRLVLQITQGNKKIWTSADCAEGRAQLNSRLRRGVPTTVPITWDGQRSAPGCPVPGTAAKPGTYTATATDGHLSSTSVQFRLG